MGAVEREGRRKKEGEERRGKREGVVVIDEKYCKIFFKNFCVYL